jgi:hypothetical protein
LFISISLLQNILYQFLSIISAQNCQQPLIVKQKYSSKIIQAQPLIRKIHQPFKQILRKVYQLVLVELQNAALNFKSTLLLIKSHYLLFIFIVFAFFIIIFFFFIFFKFFIFFLLLLIFDNLYFRNYLGRRYHFKLEFLLFEYLFHHQVVEEQRLLIPEHPNNIIKFLLLIAIRRRKSCGSILQICY